MTLKATVLKSLMLAAISISPLPAHAKQQQVAASGAWRAIVATEATGKACFVLSAPTQRMPADLKRDPGHLFVRLTKGEGTEISSDLGYRLADISHRLTIEGRTFNLTSSGSGVWLESPSEELPVVAAMRAGLSLQVTVRSARGNDTSDTYDLTGFSATLDELRKRCLR